MQGKLITLEGIDGAGKSSHLPDIVATLARLGIKAIQTREPGGTPLGEKLRGLLLYEPMNAETEALLMFAARREHLAQVIQPALTAGQWVVSDRFTDASFAYQGGGRGVALTKLSLLERWVQDDLQPHLTLLFDLPVAVALGRVNDMARPLDRFEQERQEFFQRVREAYLQRARASGRRICVLDGALPLATLQAQIDQIITHVCNELSGLAKS